MAYVICTYINVEQSNHLCYTPAIFVSCTSVLVKYVFSTVQNSVRSFQPIKYSTSLSYKDSIKLSLKHAYNIPYIIYHILYATYCMTNECSIFLKGKISRNYKRIWCLDVWQSYWRYHVMWFTSRLGLQSFDFHWLWHFLILFGCINFVRPSQFWHSKPTSSPHRFDVKFQRRQNSTLHNLQSSSLL